jgi:hypothetical protein
MAPERQRAKNEEIERPLQERGALFGVFGRHSTRTVARH